jgi:ABC-2 type transport system permease protein/ribosome-dependent ATPase
MNPKRAWVLAYKEWREVMRDRVYFLLAYFLSIMLMMVFGYGLSQDVENVPLAMIDYDRTGLSRDYARHFIGSRYFHFKGYLGSIRKSDTLLADGEVRAVIVIPEDFEERITEGRTAHVQALFDGTFTKTVRTAQSYIEAINAAASGELQAMRIARELGVTLDRATVLLQPVKVEVRYLFNQELRSIWAIAPGLIMFVITVSAPLLAALGVVREKETGAIYNIYSSTVTRFEFLAGKLLPYVAISFMNGIILWLLAVFYFDAPFRGSLPAFTLALFLYVLCMSSLGLVLSLLVNTQQAAMVLAVILSFIIAVQFSGIFTPITSLPPANALVSHFLPAMHFNTVIEGSFLKGMGVESLWRELTVFVLFTGVMLGAAWTLFRKRIRG